ncbi:MAG: helix-turn-helix domain-containing protein [Oscillospiraceae bacterium]
MENKAILYTVSEVAKLLHTNKSYVYELINANKLPALKLGSKKVRAEALDTFLREYEGMDLTNPYEVKTMNEKDCA